MLRICPIRLLMHLFVNQTSCMDSCNSKGLFDLFWIWELVPGPAVTFLQYTFIKATTKSNWFYQFECFYLHHQTD